MATINDVARKAKVSVVTVSRLLNHPEVVNVKSAKKIYKAMDELRFQPSQIARSLVKRRTNTLGVIIPDVKNPFFNNWFRCLEEYAIVHKFSLLLCNTDDNAEKEMRYVKLMQAQRVDGVVIVPYSKRSVEYLIGSGQKFVLVDRIFKDLEVDFVTTDHFQGGYQATQYLIKLGHTRIGILRGAGCIFPDVERYSGFEKAMKENNIPIDEGLIMNCDLDEGKAYERTKEVLRRRKRPTAVFSFNGLMSSGFIQAVQEMSLSIPQYVSLLSFDEIQGHRIFRPRLTHIIQPIRSLGEFAIDMIAGMINNTNSTRQEVLLKPELVLGDSCRRI